MENRKDIGKVFSEKLYALEKSPSDAVWNNISLELQKKKKRRFAFFIFWAKISGLLLVGVLTTWLVYQHQTDKSLAPNIQKESSDSTKKMDVGSETITIENNQKSASSENVTNSESTTEDKTYDKTLVSGSKNQSEISTSKDISNSKTVSGKNSTFKKGKTSKEKYRQLASVKFKKSLKKKNTNSEVSKEKSTDISTLLVKDTVASVDLSALQNGKKTSLKEEKPIKKKDSLAVKKERDKVKNITMTPEDKKQQDSAKTYRKFDVDAFVSPTLYGNFSNKSDLDTRLDSLPNKSKIKWSYGIGLSYELTEKISIRIGYTKTNLTSTTQGAEINTYNYSGISYNQNVSNQTIFEASNTYTSEQVFQDKMDITQKISYTEIPLEVKYRFLNSKVGLEGIFGFSYLSLDKNTVSITTTNGYSQEIGKTKGLSPTSITLNIGAGFSYELFKNTKLIAEPMLNYQIMAHKNNNYKAYYFGIHTGIRYTFLNK